MHHLFVSYFSGANTEKTSVYNQSFKENDSKNTKIDVFDTGQREQNNFVFSLAMALNAALINRTCSPMHYTEENLDESREQTLRRKQQLENAQKTKSPFLVGTIEEVNKKVSRLDRKLQSYTALVVESRASQVSNGSPNNQASSPGVSPRDAYMQREREAREVEKFAGIYSIKSTFLGKPSERARNLSKISMQPSKTSLKKDTGKPKFVELHQFPGYESSELTPLPNEVSALSVLSKVANAQPKLKTKPHYRPEFERLFFSQMSQAILQDTFWWLFLERWQPAEQFQQKLFNRIAHNYVKLLTYAKHPQFREPFLKDYPGLLCQAIYAAYCASFPDSYRQFGNDFKEDVVSLVSDWIAGVRPAPRTYTCWNTADLEPAGLKNREDLMNNSKAKSKASVLDLSSLESQLRGSYSALDQVQSVSSMSTLVPSKRHHSRRRISRHKQSPSALSSNSSSERGSIISEVARAQKSKSQASTLSRSPTKSVSLLMSTTDASTGYPIATSKTQTNVSVVSPVESREDVGPTESSSSLGKLKPLKAQRSKERLVDGPGGVKTKIPMTPIHEFDEEPLPYTPSYKNSKMDAAKSYSSISQIRKPQKKESLPVGKGPDFVRTVFNTCGQSPLVAHFLAMKNVDLDGGLTIRVQRTEIENMPPDDALTYRELVRDSYKKVKDLSQSYQTLYEQSQKEGNKFIHRIKAESKEYLRREGVLLAKPREVKRLSDLIMLELKKDQDSVTAGASAAIEAALMAQS